MDFKILEQLFLHDGIKEVLSQNAKQAESMNIAVEHKHEIIRVFDAVANTGSHKWWESSFGWSPMQTGVWKPMLHPVVIVLIGQVSLGIMTVATLV